MKKPVPDFRPLMNDFLCKWQNFTHSKSALVYDANAGARIRFFTVKPAAMISLPRAVIRYL